MDMKQDIQRDNNLQCKDIRVAERFNTSWGLVFTVKDDRCLYRVGENVNADGVCYIINGIHINSVITPQTKTGPSGQCHLDNDIGQKAKETDYHRMVVSLLACRENYQQTGIRNRQMFPSVSKKCTIQLLGYSVEEAYCRLEFDFARV